MPRPDADRPVLEFAWAATRALRTDRRVEVRTIVPVPAPWMRRVQNVARRVKGAGGWPPDLETRLGMLVPAPELVPYLPRAGASLDAAASAVARHLAGWPERVFGSILDEGGYVAARTGQAVHAPAIAVAHGTDARTAVAVGRERGAGGAATRTRWTVGHARILTVSAHMARVVARIASRPEVVPFTVFAGDFPIAASVSPVPPIRLLFVGRLSREKGLDRRLGGLARMTETDWRLDLVGPEVSSFDARARVDALGLAARVEFRGNLPQDEVATRYATAHGLALPTRAEALGNVIIESLLVGRPVIAAAVGGVPEVVTPDVGRLVEGEDDVAWAAALERFCGDVVAGRFEPAALRAAAEPWTWEAQATRLVDFVLA